MRIVTVFFSLLAAVPLFAAQQPWIERSNRFTQLLIDASLKHAPESGSRQGLTAFDKEISQPTRADADRATAELQAVLAKLNAQLPKETDRQVAQDLQILIDHIQLQLREINFSESREVPFTNASSVVFSGLRTLLDEQVAPERRGAALVRLRKYAGMEPGYRPLTAILEERVKEQMGKPGVFYPAKVEVETELARTGDLVNGIPALFRQFHQTGWEQPYAQMKSQLNDYDAWVRRTVLPRAREDFRLPPEEYALAFEEYGITIPPAQISAMAHQAFTEIQQEMGRVSAEVARNRHLPSADYRSVIRELKKQQITGAAILPFYEKRLGEIEQIIREHRLVTLPKRPARIRIATPAESAQQPAPHMAPPPFLNNTGEKGTFVLPLNMASGAGSNEAEKVNDYTFDAAAWTMIAHEVRPGHELQFDSMVEHGVSLARALYAFNSTNAEGWGLYAEYITLPYMPADGQLISLQFRLLRAARAFLDPELQSGKLQPADAMKVLTEDVVVSKPFANQEVERYTYRSPGQANSYFYGFTKLLELRKQVEAKLGPKFNAGQFHDFILAQGLLPPDLMRGAVMTEFVNGQKGTSE